jgi:hypothetical protein
VTDWASVASFATAGGTLVLAAATFSSVRSANRAARTAERALLSRLHPVLMPSRPQDPPEKVTWMDEHMAKVGGGRAHVDIAGGVLYLAMPLRNAGTGIAVLHGWHPTPERLLGERGHAEPAEFRRLTRDLYVPAGDTGFWQGALRDESEPIYATMTAAIQARQSVTIDVLYSDLEGGQRTISRFALTPIAESEWLCLVARHWNLDRPDPR